MTWLGLGLVVAGVVFGLYPLLPVTAAGGLLAGVPHTPAWASAGMAVLGVGILLWARSHASS